MAPVGKILLAASMLALGGAALPAHADAVLVVHPVIVVPHVVRVKPRSYVKAYPFGRLREDYTPYGMIGVRARDYFDVIEGRPHRWPHRYRRHLVRAAY